ncbi:MAG: CPBP family intramembrane metalloprotease [Planctomycetes bacterium]|nr:CPBP family intramembrane metalloprotease [Planctomycetota bacterium]MBL7146962.1 CPBP family intramembrane metalloprotease [Phycisphaerae bacterium]
MISKSKLLAWRNVGAIAIVFCLIFGVLFFCFFVPYVAKKMALRPAAAVITASAGVSSLIVIYGIVVWLRRNNRSLKELGWGKPTNFVAVAAGVVFAIALAGGIYMNNRRLGAEFNLWEISLVRIIGVVGTVIGGSAEEIAMRGLIMTELNRIKVKTWLQVLASSLCFAIYHNLYFLIVVFDPNTFAFGMVFCFFMGCIFSGIYILGRRSLTPCIISHGLGNLIVEPFHIMAFLSILKRFYP